MASELGLHPDPRLNLDPNPNPEPAPNPDSDHTLTPVLNLTVALAQTRRLDICLDEQAAEGAVGCFVRVVGYGGTQYTFERAVAALLRCRRAEDGMIRVRLQVGDPFEVCRVTRRVWVAPPDDHEYSCSTALPLGTVRARPDAAPRRPLLARSILGGGVVRLCEGAHRLFV